MIAASIATGFPAVRFIAHMEAIVMDTHPSRWLIVDDHAMFADALSITLGMIRPNLTVQIATTAQAAIELVRHTRFDFVILDLQLPDMPCVELYEKLRALDIGPTLICSAAFQPQTAEALRKLGVNGYITKEFETADILAFADRILEGEAWVCAPKYARQLERFKHSKTLLTQRQLSILSLIDKGATTRQVAAALSVSENTIKTHIRLMYDKLRASNRAECLTKAKQLHLL